MQQKTIQCKGLTYVSPEVKTKEFSPHNMLCISNNLNYGAVQEAGEDIGNEDGGSF